jgi:acyl-CoA synthetase (AMP-forming)/AMP-acid ligase II
LTKIEFDSPLNQHVGLAADEWGIYCSYGLSETFTMATALPASAPADARHGTNGLALPGMSLRILDPQSGAQLADPSEEGEIAVRGVTMMRGYYKLDPEVAFDDEGYFRTQDGGWIDDAGRLHWKGRLSNLIKTGGANVSPLEIEAAALECAGITAGLAIAVPHPTLGEAIVLCALAAENAQPEEQEIRRQLRERLAAYKVPRRVLFFSADEIAFTGTQKIQAGPLRTAALERLVAEDAEIEGHRYGVAGTSS